MATNKKSFGLKKAVLQFVLATLLAVITESKFYVQRNEGVRLAYVCVTPHSPPPKDDLPVIMLHGLTDMKDAWDGIYQNIAFFDRRRVCIYDCRDHGYSGWNDTFNIDVMADDLGKFLSDMKVEKAIIVGHSMGGLTGMRFALKHPCKVERLFLEDIPVHVPQEVSDGMYSYLSLLKSSLSAITAGADEEEAIKAVAEHFRNETTLPSGKPLFRTYALHLVNGVWQWRMNIDVMIKAFEDPDSWYGKSEGRYDGKVYLIYGKDSPLKVWDDKEAIVNLFPNTEFFGVEGAGHVIHGNFPIFLRKVIQFLK